MKYLPALVLFLVPATASATIYDYQTVNTYAHLNVWNYGDAGTQSRESQTGNLSLYLDDSDNSIHISATLNNFYWSWMPSNPESEYLYDTMNINVLSNYHPEYNDPNWTFDKETGALSVYDLASGSVANDAVPLTAISGLHPNIVVADKGNGLTLAGEMFGYSPRDSSFELYYGAQLTYLGARAEPVATPEPATLLLSLLGVPVIRRLARA